ncbi:MAG: hypothetical protein ABIV10_10690 [Gemmatimonadaceae bacterium]
MHMLIALVGFGSASCERPSPVIVPAKTVSGASSSVRARPHTIDDQFRSVGALVPEFGGFYLDDSGRPTVVLTRDDALPAARAALTSVFEAGFGRAPWQSASGRYGYLALANWRDDLTKKLLRGVNGVSSTGLDHMRNKVRVGVTSDAGSRAVTEALAKLGIPTDAVIIAFEEPDKLLRAH